MCKTGCNLPRYPQGRAGIGARNKREKLWRGEWREYYIDADGKEQSHHKSKTWSRANYSKAKAQAELDALMLKLQQGGPKADGSMTVSTFWRAIFYPIRSAKLAQNSRRSYESSWRTHIEPVIGSLELQNVKKHAIETVLVNMAKAGKGKETIGLALTLMSEVFLEAVENDYINKNPARSVTLPACPKPKETRSMEEDEVRSLWDSTTGRDRLIWRLLVLTGPRIGEVLALNKSDIRPDGLVIDESALDGCASTTKNRKTRIARLPTSLRSELEEWVKNIPGQLLFTDDDEGMLRRNGGVVTMMLRRARKIIPDLTFRMCRTTFATLFDGDPRDAQDILGHSTVNLTMRVYRKPIVARQQAAVEELDARLSGKVVRLEKRA
jgi:integrase